MGILSKRGIGIVVGIGIVSVYLLLLIMTGTAPALADGGGFPTNTPTRIPPTATFTPTPTQPIEGQIFLPAASPTIQGLTGADGSALLGIDAPTPLPVESQRPAVSIMACWPFALVVLAFLVVGIWWLRNRLAQDAYESME